MSLYIESVLTERISFKLGDLDSVDEASFSQFIEKFVISKFEGVCMTNGYIKKKSVKIIAISSLLVVKSFIFVDVTFSCDVYCPIKGSTIECKVASTTKAGIRAFASRETLSPFVAFVTKDYTFEDSFFETLQIGDVFTAKVIGFRYEMNDKHVQIIAEFIQISDVKVTKTPSKIRMQKKKKTFKQKQEEQEEADDDEQEDQPELVEPKKTIKPIIVKKTKGNGK